jgi:hypothetical protein
MVSVIMLWRGIALVFNDICYFFKLPHINAPFGLIGIGKQILPQIQRLCGILFYFIFFIPWPLRHISALRVSASSRKTL